MSEAEPKTLEDVFGWDADAGFMSGLESVLRRVHSKRRETPTFHVGRLDSNYEYEAVEVVTGRIDAISERLGIDPTVWEPDGPTIVRTVSRHTMLERHCVVDEPDDVETIGEYVTWLSLNAMHAAIMPTESDVAEVSLNIDLQGAVGSMKFEADGLYMFLKEYDADAEIERVFSGWTMSCQATLKAAAKDATQSSL